MQQNNNTDTHQTEEAFGVPQDQLRGLISSVNEGYKTFCKKKKNALGKKCDRRHLMPNSERLYNQDYRNPNKSD
jgi:hypothetical protein